MFMTALQVPINHKHWDTTVVEVTDTQREAREEHANKIPENNSEVWTYTKFFSKMTKRGHKNFEDGWQRRSVADYTRGRNSAQWPSLNGKGKDHIRTGHEGPEGEKRHSSTRSLTSALEGVGGQRHAPPALPPEETR